MVVSKPNGKWCTGTVAGLFGSSFEALRSLSMLRTHSCLSSGWDTNSPASARTLRTLEPSLQSALAYQIAFDLYGNATQQFLLIVKERLLGPSGMASPENSDIDSQVGGASHDGATLYAAPLQHVHAQEPWV